MSTVTDLLAYTKNPNTEETDKEIFVLHVVEGRINDVPHFCEIMATDPMNAIDSVRNHPEEFTPKI